MPIPYRGRGERQRSEGTVENVCWSGMFFRAEKLLDTIAPLETQFELPAEIGRESGAQVACRGEIVQTVLAPKSDELPSLAARIADYRLVRAVGREGVQA